MITYVDFSLFESPAQILVNTVNTVGVMGKGIAKEFKRIYPEMFKEYQELCERSAFDIGGLWLYKTSHKWVLNFPTKKHWRSPSKPEYIKAGLKKFVQIYQEAKITSISFPQIGCGNGELDWKSQVKPLMKEYLDGLPIEILIHTASARSPMISEHLSPKETKAWLRSEPESLAFTEVWEDLANIVAEETAFSTLDGQEHFTVELFESDDEDRGLKISLSTETVYVYKDQLLDLWQQIRDIGLCIPRIMPSGLDIHARHLLPLLSKLPYMRLIAQANHESELSIDSAGLLLRTDRKNSAARSTSPEQLQLV